MLNTKFYKKGSHSGQAMLEFALVFPIVLVLIMGVIELSMISVANQIVNYAAFCAARSAIVNGAFDKAAVLALMMLSPVNDITQRSAPLDVISELQKIKINNAAKKFKNAFAQTYIWVDCYDKNKTRVARITTHLSNNVQPLPDNTDYVKAGVLYLYRLQFPVIATLVNFAGKYFQSASAGGDVKDIFYVDSKQPIKDMPFDQWTEAQNMSRSSGMIFIPISKFCIMGKN